LLPSEKGGDRNFGCHGKKDTVKMESNPLSGGKRHRELKNQRGRVAPQSAGAEIWPQYYENRRRSKATRPETWPIEKMGGGGASTHIMTIIDFQVGAETAKLRKERKIMVSEI